MLHVVHRSQSARAPAKVNLYLGVGALRWDGYHELATVYQALDMWDYVTISESLEHTVECSGPGSEHVPLDRSNLASQAVCLLFREMNCRETASISISKGIPVAGGMAGGSADAAAALVAANELFSLGCSRPELSELAARLGSDVPFCLQGGTALGTGRGEKLSTLLRGNTELHWVVAIADSGLSTPAVYHELDRLREVGSPPELGGHERLIAALASGSIAAVAAAVGNDMEPAAISLKPALRRTLRAGVDAGALAAMVSGSGPTCVFLCADRAAALDVGTEISGQGVCREISVTSGPVEGAALVRETM